MNRKEAAELLPIIQAFSEGRTIEFKDKRFKDKWDEMSEFPDFSFKSFEFRIKPKLKYRPFKNAEECWTEMQNHQPFGWIKGKEDEHHSLITSIIADEEEVYINGISGFVLDEIMEYYTFADGTPFGVKKEEQLWRQNMKLALAPESEN